MANAPTPTAATALTAAAIDHDREGLTRGLTWCARLPTTPSATAWIPAFAGVTSRVAARAAAVPPDVAAAVPPDVAAAVAPVASSAASKRAATSAEPT